MHFKLTYETHNFVHAIWSIIFWNNYIQLQILPIAKLCKYSVYIEYFNSRQKMHSLCHFKIICTTVWFNIVQHWRCIMFVLFKTAWSISKSRYRNTADWNITYEQLKFIYLPACKRNRFTTWCDVYLGFLLLVETQLVGFISVGQTRQIDISDRRNI